MNDEEAIIEWWWCVISTDANLLCICMIECR